MKLKGPKFFTIDSKKERLIIWVNAEEDKEFPDAIVTDSTEEEKEYWFECMNIIDKKVKNKFMGVGLTNFESWKLKKNKKKQNEKRNIKKQF